MHYNNFMPSYEEINYFLAVNDLAVSLTVVGIVLLFPIYIIIRYFQLGAKNKKDSNS